MKLNEQALELLGRSVDAGSDFLEGKISLETYGYIDTDCSERMHAVAKEAASLDPPQAYGEFHRHWIKSINLCDSSMFESNLYFKDGDVSHIKKSNDILEESMREFELAMAVLPT